MNTKILEYYVYVYIDPRNFEEFYYGKGKGKRKFSHLSDDSDNEKTKRIRAIKKVGLEPIVKVIANKLSEEIGEDFIDYLGYNPLYDSYDIFFTSDNVNNLFIDHVKPNG